MAKKKNKSNSNKPHLEQKQGDGEIVEKGEANETKNEENKEEKSNKNSNSIKDVILRVHIHCEGCSKAVSRCLRGFVGVEEVLIDDANNKVTVQGKNLDPMKILKRLQKKYSRNTELISPIPKCEKQEKKSESSQKKEEAKMKTVVLKMLMHCEGCARDIKKDIEKMRGIMSVETDMSKSSVVVKGQFDPPKLAHKITHRLGKFVEILKQEEEKGKGGKEANEQKGSEPKDSKESNKKEAIGDLIFSCPPLCHVMYVCPLDLSDDNVNACTVL